MKINRFFTEVLGAHLKNPRWSWGAQDQLNNRVYLRVWEDQVFNVAGRQRVQVGYPRTKKSNGYAERDAQLNLIRSGVQGFGVVCVAVDTNPVGVRKIATFEDRYLVRFGDLVTEGDYTYAEIDSHVSVEELTRSKTAEGALTEDLQAISRKKMDTTTKQLLMSARVGQGRFRSDVLRMWGGRCAVTGASTLDAIRASHIKPWRNSSNEERLDAHNGLPLVANLDALFDAGLVSFTDDGEMLVSVRLNQSEQKILSLVGNSLRKKMPKQMRYFMEFHRTKIFHAT